MNEITVKVDHARAVAAFRKGPEIMRRHVGDALERGAQEVAREARSKAPKLFSTLTNSILPMRVGKLHYRVSTDMNYARPVEEGRLPGSMPGMGLTEWVRFRTGLQGRELDRTTFVIARAIARRGIAPQPYMKPAADEKRSRVIELVRAAVAQGVREVGQ